MANKTVAQPSNASGEGGYTGYANVQEVDTDVPANFKPSTVYKNARGKWVDPYGNKLSDAQAKEIMQSASHKAGQVGSEEQKSSVQFNVVEDDEAEGGTNDAASANPKDVDEER